MNSRTVKLVLAALIATLCGTFESFAVRVQWRTQDGGNGHWYEAVLVGPTGITWAQAKTAAEAAGGHLVTINSAAENAFVYGLVAEDSYWFFLGNQNGGGPWLGGFQPAGSPEPGGGWQWVTTEQWNYTNWEAGEPNNFSGPENYLAFWVAEGVRKPTWNDVPAVTGPSYVIEWPSLEDGLVAYYPFNGNANDESRNGNHGTVSGATPTADRFGNANSAYSFDGNDGITIPNSASLNISGHASISIAAWVKPNSVALIRQGLVWKWGPGADEDDQYTLHLGYDTAVFGLSDEPTRVYSQTHIQVGKWYFLVGVYDAAQNKIRLYVDGVLEEEMSLSYFIQSTSEPVYLGKGVYGDEYSQGVLDDVRIYNRALSDREITQLAGECSPAFTDNFDSGPSPLWGNETGNWTASGGKYFAQTTQFPDRLTYSSLPFSLTDFTFDVDITDVAYGGGGIWLRTTGAPGHQNGVLLVIGGDSVDPATGRLGLYWHIISDGTNYVGGILNRVTGLFEPGVSDPHIRVVVQGETYAAYVDGASSPATTLTTSLFTSGRVGLYDHSLGSGQSFDNARLDADCDGDGVGNADDLCPDTPADVIVDADGCSIDQLVPCDAAWKNHGAYVSAVARTAEQFLADGLITEEEKDAIVAEAGKSNCGGKR